VSRAADARDYAGGFARVEKDFRVLNEFKGLAEKRVKPIHVLERAPFGRQVGLRNLPLLSGFRGESMMRYRSYNIAFKRRLVEEYLSGPSVHALSKRYDVGRARIRLWAQKAEAGSFDDELVTAHMISSTRRGSKRWSDLPASVATRP
jgi:hypothetical protein